MPPNLDDVRQELIGRMEADDCRCTERAERDGKAILRRDRLPPTEREIVRYVLRLLRDGYPFHRIRRGQPEGSLPDGHVMNNADGRGLYIEMTIERGEVWIVSFHTSIHYKGAQE